LVLLFFVLSAFSLTLPCGLMGFDGGWWVGVWVASAPTDEFLLSGSLRFLTILILVLPAVWLVCFVFYWGRRTFQSRVNRHARLRIASAIPLTPFRREQHMTSPNASANASASAGASAGASAEVKQNSGESGAGASAGAGAGAGAGASANRKIHNESCAVCMEDFKDEEMVKILPCKHAFHAPCIDPW
jgi:hypothetical protein